LEKVGLFSDRAIILFIAFFIKSHYDVINADIIAVNNERHWVRKRGGKMLEFQTPIKDSDIKIALIATYPKMSSILIRLASQKGVFLYNEFASFDDAAAFAQKHESEFDAILSRGATAAYIERVVGIPVVSIPISPFDLIQTLFGIETKGQVIAFFNYRRKIFGVRLIEKIFQCKIHEYTFENYADIEHGIQDSIKKDIKTVIGGTVAKSLADSSGMNGIEISSGEETIYNAFLETIKLVNTRKDEMRKAARKAMAFDSLTEGIVILNEKNEVSLFNSAMEKISEVDRTEVLNKNIREISKSGSEDIADVFRASDIKLVLETGKKIENKLHTIGNAVLTVNHFPVKSKEKVIGLVSTFDDVTKIVELENQIRNKLHMKGFVAKHHFSDIVTSPDNVKMKALIKRSMMYANTKSTILIQGESGTGKELFAQSIHNESAFAKGPFVAVNCAAIPANLLESELFGYEPGAFTGAKKEGKQGLFELAHNGTIFLDEVGEVPMELQPRLLRVIEEREIMRVGGDRIVPVNVRIISATNKDLKRKVEKGEFREDLFYRLNVLSINIPPLRERKEDIGLIIRAFLLKNYHLSLEDWALIEEIMPRLIEYHWPGNIRQLVNVIERISLLFGQKLDPDIRSELLGNILDNEGKKEETAAIRLKVSLDRSLKSTIADLESQIIELCMVKYDNNQQEVMKRLDIGRSTLWRKVKKEDNHKLQK